jgi:DNA-directed RNA polymerase II subunit RPB7
MSSEQNLVERFSQERILHSHVVVPPHALKYNLHYVIQDRLSRSLRGKCTEENGFIMELKRITAISEGVIDRKNGAVHYDVDFVAKILRPQTGDVLEAVVSRVFKIGVFADLGPLSIFVPLSHMPKTLQFETLPVPSFREESTKNILKPGSEVRVKIEKIAMLDDNFMPSNSTCCVLKAMGQLLEVKTSLRAMKTFLS